MKFTLTPQSLKRWLTGGAIALIFGLIPAAAYAQMHHSGGRFGQVFEQLNLTPDQQTQLQQIRDQTHSSLQDLLTDAQREQFKTTMQNGGSFMDAFASMNLTDDQRQQLRSIMQSARENSAAVLTQDQQDQLRSLMQEHRETWQNHHQSQSPSQS